MKTAPSDEVTPAEYERSEADPDAPAYETVEPDVLEHLPGAQPFVFSNAFLIPIAERQAVRTGWLPRWGSRPMGVTWHWGASGSLLSLSRTLGGAHAARRNEASAHYGVGRSFADGVHRYVLVGNRSWHAGTEQKLRWDGKALTTDDEKCTRTTIGVETDHRGHVSAGTPTPASWFTVRGSLGEKLKIQPWTEEQVEMMIAVGREIQAAWGHLGPRDHHGHSDVCPAYKTDVTGFPFARVLRGIYPDHDVPDVWTPYWTIEGRQRALAELGYDLGPAGVDGDWGPASRRALAKFKEDNGMPERERANDPVGGHWTTFVGWAIHDRRGAVGLPSPMAAE